MRNGVLRKKAVSNQRAVAVITSVVTLIIVFIFVAISVTPVKYDIAAGEVAPATITAGREVVDTVSTQAAAEEAKALVQPVYTIDETVTANIKQHINGFFDSAVSAAGALKDAYINSKIAYAGEGATREDFEKNFDASKVNWESFMTEDKMSEIRTMLGIADIPNAAIYALAAQDAQGIRDIGKSVGAIVSDALDGGIMKEHLQLRRDDLRRRIEEVYTEVGLSSFAYLPVNKHLEANLLFDAEATDAAMKAAAKAVEPVTYKQNQTVVVEGEVVTEAQLAVLISLGVVGGQAVNIMLYVGMFLFMALIFAVYAVYLIQFDSEVITETKKLIVFAVITIIIVAISVPLSRLDTRIIPVFFGTMLASVIVSQRSALALNVFLAFIVGAVSSWETGLLSETMLRTVMITIIGGTVSVFALYRPGYRAALIYAGLIAGSVGAALTVLTDVVGSANIVTDKLLADCVYALGSGLLSGVLAIGTLPVWEAVFRVSTPAKLLELSDPNHPLLKRLTVEAPGTYHHSILTANLAEAGADAVGANALLCRVGAYYHDVGKLKSPKYYNENQKGENPHDMLDPRESAKIITSHLTHGLELAHKHKLPGDVQRIMVQHHGDSFVPYFLHKAKEAGMDIDDALFKYQGSRPSTKESAVVMLADCVEAAVRSLDEPDKEQVRDMINSLIRSKYNEGQLDECPLSRRDLNVLAKAFLNVFDGAFHDRIKYPGQENNAET
ncbi:MAG: HD family phosphohydrolase [Christensenellales bacterium]|jgi:putative nucleotidyltransferase with HDIG domain